VDRRGFFNDPKWLKMLLAPEFRKDKEFMMALRETFQEIEKAEEEKRELSYNSYIEKAISSIGRNRFKDAERFFKNAISTIPSRSEAYFMLGKLLHIEGRLKEAIDTYKIALENAKRLNDLKLVEGISEELENAKRERKELRAKKEIEREIKKEEDYKVTIKTHIELFDEALEEILREVELLRYEDKRSYDLNLLAQQVSILEGFDQLLALDVVKIDHYEYQIDTAKRVLKRFKGRALLADEVGLGKTIEAGLVLKEYVLRGLVSRALILTPPSLVSQWKEELYTKFGMDFVTTDDPVFSEDGFWHRYQFIIASLHTAKRELHSSDIQKIDYDLLIVDEAHHLRSSTTLSFKFVNQINSKFTLFLTATPVQNDLKELYNLITILKPGQLKTYSSFRKNFIERGDPRKPKNRERLRELLGQVMIRNTRAEVSIRLPRRFAETRKVSLSEREFEVYNLVSSFIKDEYIGAEQSKRFTLQILQREIGSSIQASLKTLKRLCRASYINEGERLSQLFEQALDVKDVTKIKALLDILNSTKERCLVFTQFLETQSLIFHHLKEAGIACGIFNGEMTNYEKDLAIKEFQSKDRVLICTEVGGEGRNLQFCNTLINFDLPWNPMRIEQRIGRIHRVGQERETYIFNLSSKGTIEDYILRLLDEKINMFELVIGEMDHILGNLEEEFEEKVFEIWRESSSYEELNARMDDFGQDLISAKNAYLETRRLDEELFGDDYGST